MPTLAPNHINVDDTGVARIDESRMTVTHLIDAWKSGASTPEKIRESYPFLSMAEIHAAFAYYYDHQAQIDAEIERARCEFEKLRATAQETPGRRKLREQRLRP
jgi:uncharacterized protein (DUF433 family)